MKNKKFLDTLIERTEDCLDKVQTTTTRAGNTVERAAKMHESGVSPNVIALQMTENSPTNQEYTSKDVETMVKLYKDCRSRVVLTKKQTRALIKDQNNENMGDVDIIPST